MAKKTKIETTIKAFEESDYCVDTIQAKLNEIEKSTAAATAASSAHDAPTATTVQ
jgi:hypothetical protein